MFANGMMETRVVFLKAKLQNVRILMFPDNPTLEEPNYNKITSSVLGYCCCNFKLAYIFINYQVI